MRLIFVRHGESMTNTLHKFSTKDWKDPLTPQGIKQVQATARELCSANTVHRVYSSPLQRAVQTAEILEGCLAAPLELAPALREHDVGIYDGTTDPEGWDLYRQVQDDWFLRHQLESRLPDGESYLEMQQRFIPFVEGLLRSPTHQEHTLVLVGHSVLYIYMLPILLPNVSLAFAREHGFPYAAYVVADTGPQGLHCISWCGAAVDR